MEEKKQTIANYFGIKDWREFSPEIAILEESINDISDIKTASENIGSSDINKITKYFSLVNRNNKR